MKRLLNIMFAVALALVMVACHQDDLLPDQPLAPEAEGEMMSIRFGAMIPDDIKVSTRAVDPDGRGVQNLSVFCFSGEGLLISVETASVPTEYIGQTAGVFDVKIPNNTRIMHLVANQNMSKFDISDKIGTSEDAVTAVLQGSSGMMIYWARIEVPEQYVSSDQVKAWISAQTTSESKPIIMLRNQARVTVVSDGAQTSAEGDKEWNGDSFEVTGFAVYNTQAFGTVAPFHPVYGFPTYASTDFTPAYGVESGTSARWTEAQNVTLPERKEKLSDISDVDTAVETFVFETENSSADPVTVIIRGKNKVNGVAQQEMYYRVTLTNEDGDQVLVRRNHHYQINVMGNLKYGVETFDEALSAPATNNIWLSISDEVKSVQDAQFRLSVLQTDVVIGAKQVLNVPNLTLTFNVEALGSEQINMNNVSVSWVEADQDVSATYNNHLSPSVDNTTAFNFAIASGAKSAVGTIDLTMNRMPEGKNVLKGTLLVKYGRLQRKISVLTVREQNFSPVWVSTEVYGALSGSTTAREHIEVVFTIPEDCPEELFPMDVLISANDMDIRSAAGQVLPIVRYGEEGYGEEFSVDVDGDGNADTQHFGYKYVFTVTKPGVQRVYFENILHAAAGEKEYVTLEAAYFNRLTKVVTFSELKKSITIPNLPTYSYVASGNVEAERIAYKLVPQKRFATVHFDVAVKNESTNPASNVALTTADEFLLYSSNLDHYLSNDSHSFEATFVPYSQSQWGSGGRIYGFYLNQSDNDGAFTLHMITNKAKSAEPVRLASNVVGSGSKSVKDPSQSYSAQMFRSKVFELANYRPYRFAAQIKAAGYASYVGSYVDDPVNATSAETQPEEVDEVELTYVPQQSVEVAFDVTSFTAADGASVDPFGSGFEIYIDAEMLELDEAAHADLLNAKVDIAERQVGSNGAVTLVSTQKPKLEALAGGRFVYRVDGDRQVEAQFSSQQAVQGDKKSNERKVLKFKTKEAVSSGKITVSSNEEHVVYHSKTFIVTNKPIAGNITYGVDASSQQAVPANQFVSFARKADGSRIGSLTVTADGKYELRLRKEYDFNWSADDPVELYTSIGNVYYTATFANVKALYDAPTIKLVKMEE